MSPKGWLLSVLFAASLFAACYGWAFIWALVMMFEWESL